MRLAASRTFCTAGSKRPIRMAMMAITTNSSMSVKPRRRHRGVHPKDTMRNPTFTKERRLVHPDPGCAGGIRNGGSVHAASGEPFLGRTARDDRPREKNRVLNRLSIVLEGAAVLAHRAIGLGQMGTRAGGSGE